MLGRRDVRLFVLLAGALLSAAAAPAQKTGAGNAVSEARDVWEKAIAAKGGRERLRTIRSFVVTSDSDLTSSTRPDVASREHLEFLVVLPNRLWQFHDYRPGLMGTGGMMLDGERGQVWDSNRRPAPQMLEDLQYRLHQLQFLYLMETAPVSPDPLRVVRGSVDGVAVDIVQTRTAGERVEFAISRDTRLPVQITAYRQALAATPLGRREYNLRDYSPVHGIQMPRKVYVGSDANVSITYGFNVNYAETIFDPRRVRFESRAWEQR